MLKYSQIAGTRDSRFWPCSPSAMLKTRSGWARASFWGKNSSASSRVTLPKRPRASSTAAMVDGSSHSANASLGPGGSSVVLRSGFSRSEEHTSELQSLAYLVCRLLLEKKKNTIHYVGCVIVY